MAQYKVTRWMTASIPVVSRVEANSSEEAEEESSTAPYNYDYGNSVIGDIEDTDVEIIEEAVKEDENYDISYKWVEKAINSTTGANENAFGKHWLYCKPFSLHIRGTRKISYTYSRYCAGRLPTTKLRMWSGHHKIFARNCAFIASDN